MADFPLDLDIGKPDRTWDLTPEGVPYTLVVGEEKYFFNETEYYPFENLENILEFLPNGQIAICNKEESLRFFVSKEIVALIIEFINLSDVHN